MEQERNYPKAYGDPVAEETQNASEAMFKTAQDIERRVFTSDRLQQAQEYVAEAVNVCQREGLPVQFNFDTDKPIEPGYSMATIPMTETIAKKGRVTVGLLVAAIPDVQTVLADASGAAWAVKRLQDAMVGIVKLAAAKADAISALPYSLAEFTSSGRSSAFLAFNSVAPQYVKALKKKSPSLAFLSKILLRQILASKQFAEQQFPRIKQSNWEFIINAMIKSAAANGVEAGILRHWLETRDSVEIKSGEVDLGDIETLVQKEAEAAEAKETAAHADG